MDGENPGMMTHQRVVDPLIDKAACPGVLARWLENGFAGPGFAYLFNVGQKLALRSLFDYFSTLLQSRFCRFGILNYQKGDGTDYHQYTRCYPQAGKLVGSACCCIIRSLVTTKDASSKCTLVSFFPSPPTRRTDMITCAMARRIILVWHPDRLKRQSAITSLKTS